jgi:hypothetical protein
VDFLLNPFPKVDIVRARAAASNGIMPSVADAFTVMKRSVDYFEAGCFAREANSVRKAQLS